ncbi:LacI family DNA-binding transcriptional regulator [uncultured Chryseobacterium sp.]|uniref:LacI family DNA-binding transcriptional regulator n=1 Tax=uncultured Chryseobacterium sp. TaxID=259322 RepID=UPI0025FFE9C6|nr:LacI family DNA-binding transcriptional regulator [uncultured Chryseobacterium sp.]
MKRVTIKDLAEMLNISVSTVSRALKDHPDISQAVKARVKEAAATFNYIPNDFAINFRKKSSKVIGLIIPEMSMFFIPSIIKGISSVLHREGYHFFVLSSEESLSMEEENIVTCINSRVDGILISLTRYTKDLSHLQRIREMEVPAVIFDKTIPQNFFEEIIFDNKLYAEAAADKFIENGCKKILAIFGDENLKITQARKDFFLQKINAHPGVECKVIYCESADNVKEKLNIILDYESFDGYFAMSDETLAGLHSSLIKKKVQTSVVKVVAITEGILPKYLDESYECIINDGFSMGTMAAMKLLHLIRSGKDFV